MNWGYKILTVIILFVAGISGMVFIAMRQTNEMVDSDYYTKEMQFQKQIDASGNFLASGGQLRFADSAGVVKLMLPAGVCNNVKDGRIVFLRPSDQRKDRELLLATDNQGEQLISKQGFIKGNYRVRVSWRNNDVPYYVEQSVYLN